jgi:hypothetical protein
MGRIFDNLLQLVYYYGRITDKITKDLGLEEIVHDNKFIRPHAKELEEFYYQRHIVLHGKQVPIGFDKIGNIIFPKLKTEKNSPAGYDKNMTWSEAGEMIPLIDNVNEIEFSLPSCVNDILFALFNGLKEYLNINNIVIEPPTSIYKKKVSPIDTVNVYNLQQTKIQWQTAEETSCYLAYSGSIDPSHK